MFVAAAAAISIDGRIKRTGRVHSRDWISNEDKAYFEELLASYDVVVMGRKTYKSMNIRNQPTGSYIVMTRSPKKYKAENEYDNIKFTDATPRELVRQLEDSAAYSTLLITGGKDIYNAFLREELVDQLHITIEPVLLGSGISLLDVDDLEIKLRLIELQQLNSRGTVLLKMEVIKILSTNEFF